MLANFSSQIRKEQMSEIKSLLPILQGKLLEVSIGADYEELLLSDHTKKINGVIYGILQDVIDDFMVLNCYFVDKKGNLKSGNIVYINTWSVTAFTEVNARGCLNDVLLSTAHTRKIKALLKIDD